MNKKDKPNTYKANLLSFNGKTWLKTLLAVFAIFFILSLFSDQEEVSNETTTQQDTTWIPKGFHETDLSSKVAVRWVKNPKCNYAGCVQIEIVPKKGCDALYIEATKLDASNRNIGYTNDSTSNVGPGEVALMTLKDYGDDVVSFKLSKISCY